MSSDDPLSMPEWQAIRRECELIKQLLGSGVVALGKADYADNLGNYYAAFFALSMGIERLSKLIMVASYVIDNNGQFPDRVLIKNYGHNIVNLIERVDEISRTQNLSIQYSRPTDHISRSVVDALNSFANASRGRYANFEAIGNPNFEIANEPIALWWKEVVEKILKLHYFDTKREAKVIRNASIVHNQLSDRSYVIFFDECGTLIDDIFRASERSGALPTVQKYGRFYVLCIVRWLASIFMELSRNKGYSAECKVLAWHYEHFYGLIGNDKTLLVRKKWPL